jgi:hypothetical protein
LERIDIYANMYTWRLVDALRVDFPKLAALLGEERFFELARAYAHAHPSEHHDIGRFGRELEGFLRRHPSSAERRDAADLAALEWARAEVFVEAHAPSLGREALVEALTHAAAIASLTFAPALRVLHLSHDVLPLYRSIDRGETPPEPRAQPGAMIAFRTGCEVFHAAIAPNEAVALELARTGATLAEICQSFGEGEDAAVTAFAVLSSWLDEGLVASVGPLPASRTA